MTALPVELVSRLVKAMCPEKVCLICGEPSRRIVEQTEKYAEFRQAARTMRKDPSMEYTGRSEGGLAGSGYNRDPDGVALGSPSAIHRSGDKFRTTGWTDCGHDNWRSGKVWYYTDNGEDEMTAKYLVADVFDGLATLDDGSVDLVVTSPPFLALRSYLPADDPLKSKEIGSEPTPAAFLDTLLRFTAELRRVLAPHGSICIELGDTYSGTGESGWERDKGDYRRENRSKASENGQLQKARDLSVGWPLAKSKTLIPELFRIALAYGINPLTGQPSPAGQWRVRNVVTWARPNPPVGALGDKWRPATSDVVVACVSAKRYWDDLATRKAASREGWTTRDPRMRTEMTTENGYKPERVEIGSGAPLLDYWEIPLDPDEEPTRYKPGAKSVSVKNDGSRTPLSGDRGGSAFGTHPSGSPLLDYWVIPPGGYAGSHYAVFPPELVVPLVKAMTPERVCRECGEPSRRIVEARRYAANGETVTGDWNANNYETGKGYTGAQGAKTTQAGAAVGTEFTDLGWTDCGHNNYRPGLVLDPFAGSGTTLLVATGHGHDAVGIDLDSRNVELALQRVGPFLLEVQ